jgi:hypothetical protein
MNTSDEQSQNDGRGADEAPAVVLPSPNTQGVGGQPTGFAPGTLIAPPPVLGDAGASGDAADLSGRIEQTLIEDGRFTAFASGLVITTDDNGVVHVSGPVPSDSRRQSLLAAIRALPGVTDVQDGLT